MNCYYRFHLGDKQERQCLHLDLALFTVCYSSYHPTLGTVSAQRFYLHCVYEGPGPLV